MMEQQRMNLSQKDRKETTMKKYLFLILIIFAGNICYSQESKPSDTVILSTTEYQQIIAEKQKQKVLIKQQQLMIDRMKRSLLQRDMFLANILIELPDINIPDEDNSFSKKQKETFQKIGKIINNIKKLIRQIIYGKDNS